MGRTKDIAMATIKKTVPCANCGHILAVDQYQVDGIPPDAEPAKIHYNGTEALRGRTLQCTCGHYTVSREPKPR